MKPTPEKPRQSERFFLGIEGGATRSTGVILDANATSVGEFHGPPANIKLLSEKQLVEVLHCFAERLPGVRLTGIGIGFAGVRAPADRERIREAARRFWPGVPCIATNDLETALETADPVPGVDARVLVLAGTGSCCFGVDARGRTATVGGRGHVVGDRGSAWDISAQALRAVMADWDHSGRWPALGKEILRVLCLNDVEELIAWSLQADKTAIAGLATAVFACAARRDRLAQKLLGAAARSLGEDAFACASKLTAPPQRVQFVLNGGVLLRNPGFSRAVTREIRKHWPACRITPVNRSSCWGAALLARKQIPGASTPIPDAGFKNCSSSAPAPNLPGIETLRDSPTEKRNPRSKHLDRMPLGAAIRLFLREEQSVAKSLLRHERTLAWAVGTILRSFRRGGRLFYVGAGTSGRLGVLDASECPPTFGSSGEQVQAIIAGGIPAIWSAVEGAEDDAAAGSRAVEQRGVRAGDFVVGIAASGRTPFVWGALERASQHGAATLLVCFNPQIARLKKSRATSAAFRPDKILAPDLGPEILTGSTRLKCGTATKVVLNLFSTLALARSGKVIENLMADVNPSNAKLRERAVRILVQLEGCGSDLARAALEREHWALPEARKAVRRAIPKLRISKYTRS